MRPWKVVAIRSPETLHRWVLTSDDHGPRVNSEVHCKKILKGYVTDAENDKIWLVHRRVGEKNENRWELIWKPRRRKKS
jgi:hypothetical protein